MKLDIDWRVLAMGLPKRRFSAEELARAQPEPLTLTLRLVALLNGLPLVAGMLWLVAPGNPWYVSALVLAMALALFAALALAWRDPSHPWVRRTYYLLPLGAGMGIGLLLKSMTPRTIAMLPLLIVVGVFALWFVILYRHQHIAARLRERDEQARALALARRLATAQIQPHFLFNALATLQHWVATKDDRAAPLLASLTAYLRSVLPLFDRERLTLAEEVEAVRRYLEVMQARLGERLRFDVQLPDALAAQTLPPGLLLTLVENAVEHGVQRQLRGGHVALTVRRDGAWLHAEVRDDGPGAPDALLAGELPGSGHLGLANTRERLRAAGGRLTLTNPPTGGCAATATWPHEETPCAP